jgi:hypothetical protein
MISSHLRSAVRASLCCLAACLLTPVSTLAETGVTQPAYLPDFRFHLTARPWQPVNVPTSQLADHLDVAVHALAPLQYWNDEDPGDLLNGAIIDAGHS